MENDFDYLARNKVEETEESIDSLPVIRQLPEPKASLGKTKFLFQQLDIYFQDTLSSLFIVQEELTAMVASG